VTANQYKRWGYYNPSFPYQKSKKCSVCNVARVKRHWKPRRKFCSVCFNKALRTKNRFNVLSRQKFKLPPRVITQEDKILDRAKQRALKKGWEFNLEISDIVIPDTCPALGIPLDRSHRNNYPSIDRVDSAKGYIKGNVAVISFRANSLKNNATLSEIKAIYEWMEKVKSE